MTDLMHYRVMVYEPLVNPGGYCDWIEVSATSEEEARRAAIVEGYRRWPKSEVLDIELCERVGMKAPKIFHVEPGPDGKPEYWEDALHLILINIHEGFIPESQPEWEDLELKYFIDSAKGIMDEVLYCYEARDFYTAQTIHDIYKFWFTSLFKIAWTAVYELYTHDKTQMAALYILEELADLVIKKQHDYGSENILIFGADGLIVRVNDKVSRLYNLSSRKKIAKNESAEDSFRDIMGYCLLMLMLIEDQFTLPMLLDKKETK